jgi:PAS domain S-box-containing protein
VAGWVAILLTAQQPLLMGDIWARYLLCAPGTLLTMFGLLMQGPQISKMGQPSVMRNLTSAALVFGFYGVAAGLVVKEAAFFPAEIINYRWFQELFGFPIQLVRAACAVTVTGNMLRVLSIFYWETQAALREREVRFHMIARSTPIILFVADRQSKITFIDGQGLEAIGLTAQECLGKAVSEVFAGGQSEEESRRALSGEQRLSTMEWRGRNFELCWAPQREEQGAISGLIGLAVDISQRIRDREELERYREELVSAHRWAELGTLSATLAQELNEPLLVARLLLERLTVDLHGGGDRETMTTAAYKGFAEISKALAVLEKFSVSAQAAPRAQAEPVDLYQLIKRILAVFADAAQRVNLQMSVKGVEVMPYMAMPARELEQICFILVQNAIDAADGGEGHKLTIQCAAQDKSMELVFRDTCGGMAPEQVKSLFEPFTASKSGRITGMGLPVAQRILGTYGGGIRVESEPGKGSAFYVRIPIERLC